MWEVLHDLKGVPAHILLDVFLGDEANQVGCYEVLLLALFEQGDYQWGEARVEQLGNHLVVQDGLDVG